MMGTDTRYVGKRELFRFPFGYIFRALGGYPVDRSKNNRFVDAVCELFNSKDKFSICLTPEGTRSYAPVWKTGFWHIAHNLNIPIVMIGMDYKSKSVVIKEPFLTSEDVESDISKMKEYFMQFEGFHPELGVH